jgi:hypothetical protein
VLRRNGFRFKLTLASGQLVCDYLFIALLENVGATLKKQHAENVFFEFRGVHLASQDVGSLEKVAFELLERQCHTSVVVLLGTLFDRCDRERRRVS